MVDASAEQRRSTLVSVLAELARDYVQLRGIQEQIRIEQANAKVNQDILDIVQTRAKGGLVTGLDVASAAQQVEGIKANIPQLQQQEIQAVDAIGLLLAEPPLTLSGRSSCPRRPSRPCRPRCRSACRRASSSAGPTSAWRTRSSTPPWRRSASRRRSSSPP